jgi:hypothetical protein
MVVIGETQLNRRIGLWILLTLPRTWDQGMGLLGKMVWVGWAMNFDPSHSQVYGMQIWGLCWENT